MVLLLFYILCCVLGVYLLCFGVCCRFLCRCYATYVWRNKKNTNMFIPWEPIKCYQSFVRDACQLMVQYLMVPPQYPSQCTISTRTFWMSCDLSRRSTLSSYEKKIPHLGNSRWREDLSPYISLLRHLRTNTYWHVRRCCRRSCRTSSTWDLNLYSGRCRTWTRSSSYLHSEDLYESEFVSFAF